MKVDELRQEVVTAFLEASRALETAKQKAEKAVETYRAMRRPCTVCGKPGHYAKRHAG